ncbi:MAG TPA: carbohydrate-binding module family 20 domain-containing protein [Candidatus Acidoferrales bacterium]|nr:carbohydrate-binding module family 20 domain-containing protein [Candidatus Acidoferrales bacterium]
MQTRSGAAAMLASQLAIAVLAWSAPVSADSANTQSGEFVSYSAMQSGGTITVQQNEQLRAYVVAPNAVIQERESQGAWRAISFTDLAQGEPVVLHLTPAGMVSGIDASYTLVYARLVTASKGYVVTTSGAAYKLVGAAASSGAALDLGTFLKMRVDPDNDTAFDLAASKQPFAGGPLAAAISVTFVVTVPSNTPPGDIVYLTSDAQNWVPNAVRMSPLAANRWTATITLGQGSSLKYKYTRGSWQTAESNPAGIVIPNRSLSVPTSGTGQTVSDTVVRWSDLPS